LENTKGRHHSEDLGVNGRMILKLNLKEWSESVWLSGGLL
jgi:hypothetical protein